MADDARFGFASLKNAVTEGDGSFTDFQNPDFYLNIIPVTERFAEIGFQMNGGQSDAVFVDEVMVFNAQFAGEKFFQRDVKVMQKAGIVDDSGTIDIAEANF